MKKKSFYYRCINWKADTLKVMREQLEKLRKEFDEFQIQISNSKT